MLRPLNRANDDPWEHAGTEPRLDDVFADPIVHLVMRRDRVGMAELRAVVGEAQRRLRSRLCQRAAA